MLISFDVKNVVNWSILYIFVLQYSDYDVRFDENDDDLKRMKKRDEQKKKKEEEDNDE